MNELPLLAWQPTPTDRYGETFSHALDFDRLNKQQKLVFAALSKGTWLTLAEIHAITRAPEASASARIRDLRGMFGLRIDKRRRSQSQWEYRLDPASVPRA